MVNILASSFIFISLVFTIFYPLINKSEAAFNKQINYQGKLTTSAGVAVANGTYNMEFILYTVSSGGSGIWTETRTGANKVQVTNGLFSVMLGEVNALTSVDFNQTLYLGVNIGGTGTPGWDGEMTPRKKLGAVPAAVVSENANITNDAATSSSVYPTWVTTNSGGMPIKTSSAQLSFIPSTGALTISGYVYTPNIDTSSAAALNLGTTTQNALTLGRVGANTTINGAVVSINSNAASALNITSGTTGALTLDSGTTGSILIGTNVNAKIITIGNGVDDTLTINSSGFKATSAGALSGITTLGMNNQLTSTLATGTAPFAVTSTTMNTNLNADLLDGVQGSTYYKTGDVSMNTNPFGGRSFYINSINDAMFKADSRWVVTGNYYNTSDDTLVGAISSGTLAGLFDGNYEGGMTIPSGQYAVVNVNFSTESGGNFPSYPYGNFYLSHYYTSYSSSTDTSTVRTYSNYAPHGIGWHTYNFSTFYDNGSSGLIKVARNDVYAISQAEFKIYAPTTTPAVITEIDWQLDRPAASEMPLVDKFKVNNLYNTLNFKNGSAVTKASLNPTGASYFSGGNFGIGNTSPGELLTLGTAGTTAGVLSLAGATSGKAIIQTAAVAGTPTLTLPATTGTLALVSDIAGSFVPYTGATANVTLGTYSLTTPNIIGGIATTSPLTFQTTTGVGTTGADMHFKVGNNGATEALTILNNGNVGMGITNPGSKLNISYTSEASVPTLGTNGGALSLLGTSSAYGLVGGVLSSGNVYLQSQRVDTTATAYAMLLQPNGGNVGIGMTSPGTSLEVWGTSGTQVSMRSTGGLASEHSFIGLQNGRGIMGWDGTYVGVKLATADSSKSIIFSNSITAGSGEYARFTGTGNLGIGISAPTSNFQVAQSTTSSGTVTTNGTTTLTGSGTQFLNTFKVGDTITVSGETVRTIATITSNTVLDTTVAFATSASSLTYTLSGGDRFAVKGNGNVGIGTTSPLLKLDVRGAITSVSGLNNSSTRPAVSSTRISGEIAGVNGASLGADDGFLRLSAGGGTNANQKTFIDLSGYSSVSDMNDNIVLGTNGVESMRIISGGNIGIGVTSPTAALHLKAGSDVSNGAPLKLTSGTLTTGVNISAGAIEWDGTSLYVTQTSGPTRKAIAYTDSAISSSVYLGTTLVALNRGSGALSLAGVSIDGTANIAGGTVGAVPYQTGANATGVVAATATANKMFLSGASAIPTWSTSTIPTSAGATANKVLLSDGTNYVLSTPTFPNASAAAGKLIVSDGTNWIASTPTYPNSSATTRKILVSDGTNFTASTETWAIPGTSGNILRSDGTNWTSIATPTWNQDTTGSAGSLKSTSTTGLMTVTGMGAGTTRLKTVSDANDTLLELAGSYTPTGTWTSLRLNEAVNLTTTSTKLNYLTSATGTTGTTSTNLVFSTSPTLVTPTLGVAGATSLAATGVLSSGTNGGTGGQLTLNGSTSGSGVLKVAAAAGAGIVFQLPSSNGSNTNVLQTDGAGVTSWVAASTGMSYPGAGIAVSTGSAWGTSITDASTNWNTAYTNRITTFTTTGSSGAATLSSNTLNIPNYTLSGLGGAPLASPTFTGSVTIPTPFTLGAISVSTTGTQLNYLNAATGTTGTTSTNLVFSTSPTLVTPTLGVAGATSLAATGVLSSGTNGGTGGQLTLNGSTSGSGVLKVAAAAGAGIVFQLPSSNGSNTNVLQTDGAGVTSWVAAPAGGGRLDQISAANTTANIDSLTNAIAWNWSTATTQNPFTMTGNGLTTGSLLTLSSNGTAALTGQKGLNISLSGVNATGAQTTYGAYLSNTHSGTSNNVGLYATASGGTNNYAAIFDQGNVGIGTTTPGDKLEVVGSILLSSSNPKLYSSNNLAIQSGSAAQIFFNTNGSNERMRIDSSGNVGIGTIGPDSLTNIVGSTAGDGGTFNGSGSILHLKQNTGWSGSQPWALFVEGYSWLNGFRINAADGQRALYKTTSGGSLGFATSGNDPITFTQSDSSERMRIAAGGNLGIGTTSPTNLISLDGTSARTIWMERNTTAATAGQGLTLSSGGAIAGTNNLVGGDLTLKSGISTGTGDSAIHFFTATAGSSGSSDNNPTEKMTILGSGKVLLGATSDPNSSTSKLYISGSTSSDGSSSAIAGVLGDYTFTNGGNAGYVQVGNRFVVTNSPTTNSNTAVGELIRMEDANTGLSNTIRGLDVTANGGLNTAGTNTGIRSSGSTFGIQGVTSAVAGAVSAPAAIYGESTGTTQGDVLRLYSNTMTSATSFATFYQTSSTFTGTGLLMDFAAGSGTFSGDFINLKKGGASFFKVTNAGIVSMHLPDNANVATAALCSTVGPGNNPAAGTSYELRDCSGAPVADYAEMYPVEKGIEYGDIVAIGTEMIPTYDTGTNGEIDWNKVKGNISKLVKSQEAYQKTVIGIVSNNKNDFSSTGYNIKEGDNPMPVALNGRVPVKVSPSSSPIKTGDYITTSMDSGMATRALKSGFVIGKALEDWSPSSGQTTIMIFIEQGYYESDSAHEFANETTFNGLTFFNANVEFAKSVKFSDAVEFTVPPLWNSDTAGFAVIKRGSDRVDVVFDRAYIAQPVVSANISFEDSDAKNMTDEEASIFFGQGIQSAVTNKTPNKFTIRINKIATEDLRFSWIALSVKDPKVFESVISGLVIEPTSTSPVVTPPTNLVDVPVETQTASVVPPEETTTPPVTETPPVVVEPTPPPAEVTPPPVVEATPPPADTSTPQI